MWHNYSFDHHVLHHAGVRCAGFGGDTMAMARLENASRNEGYSLEKLSNHFLDKRKIPITERFRTKRILKNGKEGKGFDFPDLAELQVLLKDIV